MIKKPVIELIDWVLYKGLKTKQKAYIANLFTQKQKNMLKRIIKPGKKRAQLRKIERIKYRMYNLGFFIRGLSELEDLYKQNDNLYLKRLAAWELAVYHANQYSEEGARRCLEYINTAIKNEKDQDYLRRAAILKSECYNMLGKEEEGKRIISDALQSRPHADLFLAAATLESSMSERLRWINKIFEMFGTSPIEMEKDQAKCAYDSIRINTLEKKSGYEGKPKVTVIIPAFNAADTLNSSIKSMLGQTWTNLEILVVDDCSTDNTVELVKEYVKKDSRVRLIEAPSNGGAYIARNLALKGATGEFVTINDADDWSHPEKIKTQVMHLLENPRVIGNFSQQARATEDLKFYRRGKPGVYIFSNMSSFMFRRKPVMESIGYWDCVRFAGDSEFLKRVKIVFGERAVVEMKSAPLSFQRQSDTSLTGHSAFGFPGYFMGVRKEYAEAHDIFHKRNPDKLHYSFPQENRLFAIPEPMWPNREEKVEGRRHFDVIIASEFRLLGGTNMSNLEEIKAQKQLGLKTGLLQMSRYELNSVETINPKIREQIDGNKVQMVVYGEKVSCDVLIVRHPPILQEWQKYVADIETKQINVIVNQPPKRDYSIEGETLYELHKCEEHLEAYFGKKGIWYPIGPLVRSALLENHSSELESIQLASENWVNIINVDEWKRPKRPIRSSNVKIGRHSRDQYVKWPDDKKELLSIYPDSDNFEVHVLGGAKSPEKVLGGTLPNNWHVVEFGEEHPREFLSKLDVFVYYTHPDWIEAFGRVIFEAMSVGVPVIIPPHYQELFGDAAIYAKPSDVQDEINKLMSDNEYYTSQVDKAHAYVESHFGYSKHLARLGEFFHGQA